MKAADDISASFSTELKNSIDKLFSRLHFTESEQLEIVKNEADLRQWKEDSFTASVFQPSDSDGVAEKRRFMKELRSYMDGLRYRATDYSDFHPEVPRQQKTVILSDDPIVPGKCPCPVDGEKTRCCKLTTIDAVSQCAFGCSYCSVQSFYSKGKIHAVSDLGEKLSNLKLDDRIWHIGTGQASDSILLGDDYGTLSALSAFASSHPDIIIELKSKSGRNVFDRRYPSNMIFTWSLNAPTIIGKEEHFTASLEKRLENAGRARDNGNLVGFHIHPMVFFSGWDEEYPAIAERIAESFSPSDICMISIGTLTFTKSLLKTLRTGNRESRVLEMPLVPAAGKFSYPLDIKRKMFSTMFNAFPEPFRENVFFYLCMEDPSLWLPVLGREYACDKDFEADMKRAYFTKTTLL